MKVIGFYKEFLENGYLSNWYKCSFKENGIEFHYTEQYFMYYKALYFNDLYRAKKILEANDPAEIKKLGQEVTNYDDKVWNGRRQIVMYNGNLLKFTQNEDLKEALLNTGDTVIAECSKMDKIWGIGLNIDDTRIYNMSKWQGTNLLGFTLMEVRDTIKKMAK